MSSAAVGVLAVVAVIAIIAIVFIGHDYILNKNASDQHQRWCNSIFDHLNVKTFDGHSIGHHQAQDYFKTCDG